MKTVFANHSEVCSAWAKQEQRFGRAGNITFDGVTIKSYGWWPMAKFITPNVVLFRDETYSPSTGQHQSIVSSVIRHCKTTFHVVSMDLEHGANVKHYIAKMRKNADRFWQSQNSTRWCYLGWVKVAAEAKAYCNYFGCNDLLPALFGLELLGPKAKAKLEN